MSEANNVGSAKPSRSVRNRKKAKAIKELKQAAFSLAKVGWACVIAALFLIVIVSWMSYRVVDTLTEPQPFLKDYISDPDVKKKLGAEMAVSLEYESMLIRSKGIQIAYGFVVGLVFLTVGLLLFAVGAINSYRLTGRASSFQVALVSTAPGLVPMVIAGILIGLAVYKDVKRSFSVSMDRGGSPTISTGEAWPPSSGKGLVPTDEESTRTKAKKNSH